MPNRPVVLVVEDEVLVHMMLADVLDDAGFRVVEAAHVDDALRVLAARHDVAAVVTDVEMPAGSMNGYALARRVREAHSPLVVLVISGREGQGTFRTAPRSWPNPCTPKPWYSSCARS